MHRARWVLPALVLGVMLPAAGCGNNPPPVSPVTSSLLNPSGNVTLIVSNQSFSLSPVDIEVSIDGEVVVRDHFDVGDQHAFYYYTLSLSPGQYEVHVVSNRGETGLTREFTVTGKHWAYVRFSYAPWYADDPVPAQFTWSVTDRQRHFQ